LSPVVASRAAAGLLRALLRRAGNHDDRILLNEILSTEWRSLTLEGERHFIVLRLTGEDAGAMCTSLTTGLEEAEFAIPGQIVADIALARPPFHAEDGSISVAIEALTIEE